jgi:hypothetical protein
MIELWRHQPRGDIAPEEAWWRGWIVLTDGSYMVPVHPASAFIIEGGVEAAAERMARFHAEHDFTSSYEELLAAACGRT